MPDKLMHPVSSLRGEVDLPGDKSISHRALILSAISNGDCHVTGLSQAQDVNSTARCLSDLGVTLEPQEGATQVHGVGMTGLKEPDHELDAGNSGTTMRLLSGVLAAQPYITTITGDESLRKRPMRRIIEPLELMGAQIESAEYKAPLKIWGHSLRAIDYASPLSSAQVKSCILLAGLYAKGLTRVTEPHSSRDHTERMLQEMGVNVHYSAAMAAVKGPVELQAHDIDVPGDISAAAFFLVAAALLPDSEIVMPNVGVNDSRTGILDAMTAMGATFVLDQTEEVNYEPRTRIIARSSKLSGTMLSGAMIPRIIDEIPILAIAATQADGVTTIKDAGELRVKESDRLSAIAENLKRMGAQVRELKDGLVITGPTPLKSAEIDSFGDQRIAMAFSVAALIADGDTTIKDIDCVNVSFPNFYDKLESVIHD